MIPVTTQGQAVNLFDSSNALYNTRIRGTGEIDQGTTTNGILTTNIIDITNISTLTVSGITEVFSSGYSYYAYIWTYSDASATTKVGSKGFSSSPNYVFDTATLKSQYPTGVYARLVLVLKDNVSISTADTENLVIIGS